VNRVYSINEMPKVFLATQESLRGLLPEKGNWAYNTQRFRKQNRNLRIRSVPWANLHLMRLDLIKRIVTRP